MKTIKYTLLSVILIGFTACNDDDFDYSPDPEPLPALTAGSADFSKYVAVGASFSAGFTDNALFKAAQQNSFTKILSEQFVHVGGGSFSQPLMNDNIGGFLFGGIPNAQFGPRLYFNGTGPVPLPATPTTEATANIYASQGPFNNLGVPGARSFHLVADGYGNFNPYFGRMASSPMASVLGDAMAQNPTFFTLSEVGGNDVLGYATNGGDASLSDITDLATFNAAFNALVATLTSNGAKGAVTNVPYVASLPHFTTVPYNPLSPDNPEFAPQIPVLNATLAPLNQAFVFLGMPERQIIFSETEASAVVVHDETLPNIAAQLSAVLQGGGLDPMTAGLLANQFGQSRQATADDLFVLPSSSVIATVNVDYYTQLVGLGVPAQTAGQLSVNGITYPLRDRWVLLPSEQQEIITATDNFNSTIESVASSNGLALVNFRDLLVQASTTGLSEGGFTFTTSLVTGGLVGLDGIHLTSRGYAALTNKFLEAIDATYGSNFVAAGVKANPGDYPTNYPPTLQ